MEPVVLDTSVALKWYLEEAGSEEALALHSTASLALHAPDFLLLEFDSIMCARCRQKRVTEPLVERSRVAVRRSGVLFHPFESLLDPAVALALGTRKAVYDCMFLALAERLDAVLVTADKRFGAGLERTPLGGRIRLLAGV
ncbi:MAG: type II toxin-antitoxin system VapC family toxin [Phycisphaerales bacterium]|nr:type II toxin-antitoxin system VapC family toxin [Phycisphaerales bacterium]MCB9840488.1 type II toxin-antitoxin system VapC family toxin [Phycisphaeraceae bacterium]